ncbi:MAG: hypothetical protein FRX49_10509 [Trebouxia sp. A1-2]|nr:MAG: hypothetical protein FRX49_10509 [Trebouxia sp. A1-2]
MSSLSLSLLSLLLAAALVPFDWLPELKAAAAALLVLFALNLMVAALFRKASSRKREAMVSGSKGLALREPAKPQTSPP